MPKKNTSSSPRAGAPYWKQKVKKLGFGRWKILQKCFPRLAANVPARIRGNHDDETVNSGDIILIILDRLVQKKYPAGYG